MFRRTKHLATAALLLGGLSGCSDFLSGPSVDEDPNSPIVDATSTDNLFVGLQAAQATNYTSTMAYFICGWVQQCQAVVGSGRFLEFNINSYSTEALDIDANFTQIYGVGGLKDIRIMQERIGDTDPLYAGILKVWEALVISEAADKWGDIPYSEAAQDAIETPALDDQLTIYAQLVTLLDQAIVQLSDPAGVGTAVDLALGSDPAAWTALAHTLKARILLHTARTSCPGGVLAGCAIYDQIAAEAQLGIQTDAGNLVTPNSGASAFEQNGWFQFFNSSGFGRDLLASPTLWRVMIDRGEVARIAEYFGEPDIEGTDTSFALLGTRNAPTFKQPWVTADENSLILAEALLLKPAPDAAGALAELNAIRAKYGVPLLAGPATIADVLEEKFVSLFQNWEFWNDYKRHCLPALTPTSNGAPVPGTIPRRLFYGQSEQDANPNVPTVSAQIGTGFRNDNDPPPPVGCG